MENSIRFREYPLDLILEKLLIDKTTGKKIIWATDSYRQYGIQFSDRYEMTSEALKGLDPIAVQPRAFKAIETQQKRTKSKAEVFTPSWIVNKMINHLDEEWFDRPNVFNTEGKQTWETNIEKIDFQKRKWKDYVDRSVLEITCGEAPFIVSRYNASTGEIIPVNQRIGILDRKLRVVTENTNNEEDWLKWAKRAFESVYAYEYQGDNLLIGRINLLLTFIDFYQSAWKKEASKSLLTTITNIITWNFWQMDGLNGTVPLGVPKPLLEQMTLFYDQEKQEKKAPLCQIRRWRAKKTILYKEVEMREGKDMAKKKWDVVIGNPPYMEKDGGNNASAIPTYNKFISAVEKLDPEEICLIIPNRWYSGGRGLDGFREQMKNDKHIRLIYDFKNANECFPGVDISGGICYLIRDRHYIGPCKFINHEKNGNSETLRYLDEFPIIYSSRIFFSLGN